MNKPNIRQSLFLPNELIMVVFFMLTTGGSFCMKYHQKIRFWFSLDTITLEQCAVKLWDFSSNK